MMMVSWIAGTPIVATGTGGRPTLPAATCAGAGAVAVAVGPRVGGGLVPVPHAGMEVAGAGRVLGRRRRIPERVEWRTAEVRRGILRVSVHYCRNIIYILYKYIIQKVHPRATTPTW